MNLYFIFVRFPKKIIKRQFYFCHGNRMMSKATLVDGKESPFIFNQNHWNSRADKSISFVSKFKRNNPLRSLNEKFYSISYLHDYWSCTVSI